MSVFSCEQPVVEAESRVQIVNVLACFKVASCVFSNNRLTVSDLIGYILFVRLGPLMYGVCVSGMSFFTCVVNLTSNWDGLIWCEVCS